MTNAIEIKDVSKKFKIYKERNQNIKTALIRGRSSLYEEYWALRNVSFSISAGETFGMIGSNGSGKSTLLKCLAKILYPTSGSFLINGRTAALLEVGSGFHPELSGRENIFLNGSILGMTKKEITERFDSIVDFSGVGEFIDQPVKNYSSGMYVRLGFSVAIHVDPDVLLVDEVLAVGDEAFQEKSYEKFQELRSQGKTVVIVSHALDVMETLCDKIAWLEKGELRFVGDAKDAIKKYKESLATDKSKKRS